MNKILIYVPKVTPRISYVFQLIFNKILRVAQVELISDLHDFIHVKDVAKMNYSTTSISDVPVFYPDGLLHQSGISNIKPIFKTHNNLLAAFFYPKDILENSTAQKSIFPFDPFALAFYLVSRYEEYLDFIPDQYGRFPASASTAFKNGFLQKPLVNVWALKVKEIITKYYPKLQFNQSDYQFTPTYDIDHAFAFLKKGTIRQTGAFCRNLLNRDGETIMHQLKTWLRIQKDPYDCFDYLKCLESSYGLNPKYFWLLGDYGVYDKNINYKNKHFRSLISQNSKKHPIGIHPSFGSKEQQNIVGNEIHRLEKITEQRIIRSRQHFLFLKFPETYQRLTNLNIKEDYSMGYADMCGFRASIATPFYWYNLVEEQITTLQIFPFQLMDVTFNNYLKLKPEAVLEHVMPVIENTKQVGGHLISIWHNSSLCEAWEWKGWRNVYEEIIKSAIV